MEYFEDGEVFTHNLLELEGKVHDIANIMPLMDNDEKKALELDMGVNGQIQPIILYRGKVVDGRNRLNALKALGQKTVRCRKILNNLTLKDVQNYVISAETRRKQSKTQLAITALGLVDGKVIKTMGLAAKTLGISTKQVQRAKQLKELLSALDLKHLHDGNLYTTLDGKKTASLGSIIADVESRTALKFEELLASGSSDTDYILNSKDYKEARNIVQALLKGKSDNYIMGVQSVVDDVLDHERIKELRKLSAENVVTKSDDIAEEVAEE